MWFFRKFSSALGSVKWVWEFREEELVGFAFFARGFEVQRPIVI